MKKRKTYDESAEAIKHVQYDVVNENGMPKVKLDGRNFSPEEISSHILGKMKKIAEEARDDREMVRTAPHDTPIRRLDDVKAVKEPKFTFKDL